ncbi:MAG: hypothetical protein ACXWD8_09595 [Mycobacterium sp.]
MRLFMADDAGGHWNELTHGAEPAVILDVTVAAVAADFRSARRELESIDGVRYAGTVDGLAGLIADIEAAGVADGATLVAASPGQDLPAVGLDVLHLAGAPRSGESLVDQPEVAVGTG